MSYIIDEVVMGILEFYDTNNPYDILEDMGIETKEIEPNSYMLNGSNSVFIDTLNTIFIRNDLHYKHKLFYLRHELGHILLHLDKCNMLIPNYYRYEKEADYFALKLTNITLNEVEMYEMTIEQIASYLELPERALKQLV